MNLNAQFKQPDKARELTEAIESVIDQRVEDGTRILESSLRKDLEIVRTDIIGTLRSEIKEQKAENIKWMFLFWIGQIGATIGIIFYFLKNNC